MSEEAPIVHGNISCSSLHIDTLEVASSSGTAGQYLGLDTSGTLGWSTPEQPVPDLATGSVGDVLTLSAGSVLAWSTPEQPVPDLATGNVGDVLTLSTGSVLAWTTPTSSGGGGGGGYCKLSQLLSIIDRRYTIPKRPIDWFTVVTDSGSNLFDTSTSAFVAPDAGTYFFSTKSFAVPKRQQ